MTKLIIFTAPSGAGKTTIVRHLLQTDNRLAFSVSACTRLRRVQEIDGVDYYFLTPKNFKQQVACGDFVEWEEVYENQYYGTLRSEIDRLSKLGKHVLLDMDVKGAWNIKKTYGSRALVVFVKPPSAEILFNRLRNRNTEDDASLRWRFARVSEELKYENKFDASMVNDSLQVAFIESKFIINEFILLKP